MRNLLNTLYVTSEDAYLCLKDQNIVVLVGEEQVAKIPLLTIENINYFGYKGISPALLGYCAQNGKGVAFFSTQGRFLCRSSCGCKGNILLRHEQYRIIDDSQKRLAIAKNFIIGKIHNSKWVLERATRDHEQQVDVQAFKRKTAILQELLISISDIGSIKDLMGAEGLAAQYYFSLFNDMVFREKESFNFTDRNRRPPLDPVNAMLSFGYSLLAHDCASALESVGLDPYGGFLHVERPGRQSLALDLMEELRAPLVDRFVLSCINQRIINPGHFHKQNTRAVFLTEEGKKAFLLAWQQKKKEVLTHPFLEEKIEWGLVPFVQAQLLGRYIRGDLNKYPPLFWK
jgi:CRISPR-associated protein Cas1